MDVDAGDRGRGAGAGDLHADRGLRRAPTSAFVGQAEAGVRGQLSMSRRATLPRLAVLRDAPPRAGARAATPGRREHARSDAARRDVDAACRALVRALGDAGWLRHAVAGTAYGGAADALDTRALCLMRETLARHVGPGRLRLRDAGPGLGRDHARRHAGAEGSATCRAWRAARRSPPSRCPSPTPAPTWRRCAARARVDGDDCVLDGEKTWISNGGIADFYVVFARTGEAPGRARHLAPSSSTPARPGFDDRRAHRRDRAAPAGAAALQRLPRAARRSALGAAGEGFKVAMRTLDVFRTSVAAAALGFARRALDEALRARDDAPHVRRRRSPTSS